MGFHVGVLAFGDSDSGEEGMVCVYILVQRHSQRLLVEVLCGTIFVCYSFKTYEPNSTTIISSRVVSKQASELYRDNRPLPLPSHNQAIRPSSFLPN